MAEKTPIFTLKNVSLSFGTNKLFDNIDIYINMGDKISLIGRNGSGKSTLLKVIAGILEPDFGEIFIQPGINISYLPQEPDFSGFKTLREVVESGLKDKNQTYSADIMIEKLGILANQPPEIASGGERKKAALAKALLGEPDILLLDEPTNHLDMPTIEILENEIKNFKGAVVLISHDRAFLGNASTAMFWLDRGIMRRSTQGFSFFETWQEQVFDQEIIEQKNLNKKIEEETSWLHKGVTARRKRNQGRLRRLQQLRAERKEQIKQVGNVNLDVKEGSFASKLVVEAKNINKSFEGRTIVKDFSTRIIKGNKIGIVGPNGAGKTTLIKLLTKKLEPDSGFVRIGKNLDAAYFDQNRADLDLNKTLWKTLCNEGDHILVQGKYKHVVAYLKDFLFKPEQAHCPVRALSGGEKNRLMLAVALAQPSNLLILDEPTNDLDMDTLDLLQEVLGEYAGTVLVISHDRDFLDKTVSSIIYMQGNGEIFENAGSCTEVLSKIKPQINIIKKETKNSNKIDAEKKSQKLSYNQKRLLETLPDVIKSKEAELAEIEKELMNPSLYTQEPERFNQLSSQLENLKSSIAQDEETWLTISTSNSI